MAEDEVEKLFFNQIFMKNQDHFVSCNRMKDTAFKKQIRHVTDESAILFMMEPIKNEKIGLPFLLVTDSITKN